MKLPIEPPSVGVGAPKVFELDPTKPPPHVIERAYQLAKSGKFACVEEICQQLSREGYKELYKDLEDWPCDPISGGNATRPKAALLRAIKSRRDGGLCRRRSYSK